MSTLLQKTASDADLHRAADFNERYQRYRDSKCATSIIDRDLQHRFIYMHNYACIISCTLLSLVACCLLFLLACCQLGIILGLFLVVMALHP